jgi:hypothetical protein
MRSTLAVAALVSLLPALTAAQSPRPTIGFALDASFEIGGDDFLEVAFTNGRSQTVRAGQGGTLSVGGIVRPSAASPLSLRGTVGFKYLTTAADNANIRFTRVPLELTGSYELPNGVRAGAGVVYHARNRFTGDGFVPDESFTSSPGATVELGYKFIALTYTALSYKAPGTPKIDGSSVGVQLLWTPSRSRR